VHRGNLYYWFSVGREGTLPLHYLIAQNTPHILTRDRCVRGEKINAQMKIWEFHMQLWRLIIPELITSGSILSIHDGINQNKSQSIQIK
jgi:hypothetical protein